MRTRLAALMFLEYAVQGLWAVPLAAFLMASPHEGGLNMRPGPVALIYATMGISVEKGAQTTLYLATSPEVEGVSGKYFSNSKETPSSKRSYDVAVRQRLWQVSEELIRPYAQPSANEVLPGGTTRDVQ